MRKLFTATLIAFACVLLAAACDGRACGCLQPPPEEVSGTLTGFVFTPDSTPMPFALVEVVGGLDSCEPDGNVDTFDTTTNPEGRYVTSFEVSDLDDETLCVTVRAYPPAGSGFGPSTPVVRMYDWEAYYEDDDLSEDLDFYLTAP